MFDIFAKLLSSIASFLFPLFASYKALKTADPAQLTPWLMYWVVLACALLVESWVDWFLVWIPFYSYIRLLFLLYLVLPQTQGARLIYQAHIHPWMEENEAAIEELIASAHDRLRSAGLAYLKQAIELIRTKVLNLPPSQEAAAAPPRAPAAQSPQSYTQSLLARFALPGAGTGTGQGAGSGTGATTAGADLYNLLASAVNAATGAATGSAPSDAQDPSARISFIAAQRERLGILLSALDREATELQGEEARKTATEAESAASGLNKSRSEPDFVKLEAESGAEDVNGSETMRKRGPATSVSGSGGGWMPWSWGSGGSTSGAAAGPESGKSSGVEK